MRTSAGCSNKWRREAQRTVQESDRAENASPSEHRAELLGPGWSFEPTPMPGSALAAASSHFLNHLNLAVWTGPGLLQHRLRNRSEVANRASKAPLDLSRCLVLRKPCTPASSCLTRRLRPLAAAPVRGTPCWVCSASLESLKVAEEGSDSCKKYPSKEPVQKPLRF